MLTALVDLYARPHLALPDSVGALFEPEIAGSLIGLDGYFCFSAFFTLIATDKPTDKLAYRELRTLICGCFVLLADVVSRFTSLMDTFTVTTLRLFYDYDLLRFCVLSHDLFCDDCSIPRQRE